MPLCFLHGLDSSPQGTKAKILRTEYPRILVPALPADIQERARIVAEEIQAPTVLIGSSLGGLTALMFALEHPERTSALLLLAPAVGSRDESIFTKEQQRMLASLYVPAAIPTVIIAGIRDDVIPIDSIRALVRRSPDPARIQLHEVDDDHNLHQHLGLMLESIKQLRIKITDGGRMRKILISAGEVAATAVLKDNPTAEAVWKALPLESHVNTWGDEIYFDIPVELKAAADAGEVVHMGALGYWPPGKAFCIFFGRTPASRKGEIRAASAVNVFGSVEGDATIFKKVPDGALIKITIIQ